MNMDILRNKIQESGLRTGFICEKLGISRQSFSNRLNGICNFKAQEVDALCGLLNIKSVKEMQSIFFTEGTD